MEAISSILLSFLCCLLMMIISQASAQPTYLDTYICNNTIGNYTANNIYHSNLNTLLFNLSSHTKIDYGFYNFSYGQNQDKVNLIGLCRGDVKPYECRSCLNHSSVNLTQLCPNQKEAIVWYEKCMLRYSHRPIFSIMETLPWYYMCNFNNATDADQFNNILSNLLRNLKGKAASGNSRHKYAANTAIYANYQTLYGLVQCTPDLSWKDCNDCLDVAVSETPRVCKDKIGGIILKPSCNIRYEVYSFYEPTPTLDQDASPPFLPSTNITSTKEKGHSLRTTIAIVVPAVLIVVVVLLIFFLRYVRRKKGRTNLLDEEDDDDQMKIVESLQFEFDTIRVATSNFSDSNKLGEGGFGAVYSGEFSDGKVVAVKRLSKNSSQGDMEFKNEVLLVARLQHRNLVRLLGFSLDRRERLLVYEFVPNKSLDYYIFDPTKKSQLDWERRYRIIRGIARGILYLHEDSRLRIIHRDLKASNILLDEEMNPKISDFGLARLFVMDQTQGSTSTVVGTYGYMAPEYVMHGQFSVKSDVFSFGVLVLEILSGQKNSGVRRGEDAENLLSFAWRNWRDETVTNIMDVSLNSSSLNEITRCIHIGLLCVQQNSAARPTMATVALMLNSNSLSLPLPSEPAFYMDGRTGSIPDMRLWEDNLGATRSSESTTRSTQESVNQTSITELYPR